jgi:cysteine-rich repeat protein
MVTMDEQCDDGNDDPNDGCNEHCMLAPSGWSCMDFCVHNTPGLLRNDTCYLFSYSGHSGCVCGCGIIDPQCSSASSDACVDDNCPGGQQPAAENNGQCEGTP